MFSAAEMQLIRANCLNEFEKLLKRLSIPTPDWNAKDEFKIYDDVDADLTDRICKLMKSETLYDGYTNLLKLGGVSYDYSESYNQLLDMIIANRDKIIDAVRKQNTARSSWQDKYSGLPRMETSERLEVQIATAKSFNTFDLRAKLNRAKNSLTDYSTGSLIRTSDPTKANARRLIEESFAELSANSLLSIERWEDCKLEGVEDNIRRVAMQKLDNGESSIICLKVRKVVERHERDIPPEPPESPFSVREAEEALDVLERVREIILLEG